MFKPHTVRVGGQRPGRRRVSQPSSFPRCQAAITDAPLLQDPDALDGGAAGTAHLILQYAGVETGLQGQLAGALDHLGGIEQGLGPGQAAGHAAVRQPLHDLKDIGAAAAGDGGGGLDQRLIQRVEGAGGG